MESCEQAYMQAKFDASGHSQNICCVVWHTPSKKNLYIQDNEVSLANTVLRRTPCLELWGVSQSVQPKYV
jgi:hypothetical protein